MYKNCYLLICLRKLIFTHLSVYKNYNLFIYLCTKITIYSFICVQKLLFTHLSTKINIYSSICVQKLQFIHLSVYKNCYLLICLRKLIFTHLSVYKNYNLFIYLCTKIANITNRVCNYTTSLIQAECVIRLKSQVYSGILPLPKVQEEERDSCFFLNRINMKRNRNSIEQDFN